jgi:SAM-dependent MidA family methyltransferase
MKKFSEFMKEWLYGENGYYKSFKTIGKNGDFYTSVSVSKFFGGAIAKFIIKLIQNKELSCSASVFEIGAHNGYLLGDIIEFIYTLRPDLFQSLSFNIVEPFEEIREIQKKYFENRFGKKVEINFFSNINSIKEEESFVVANEIFDAFACELIYKNKMAFINDDFTIVWKEMDEAIYKVSKRFNQEMGEIATGYEKFSKELFDAFGKCYFLTFDYGDMTARNDFSIRVYTKHKVYPLFDENLNLKNVYQKSDITYDVNFSYLAHSFIKNGFEMKFYKTQLSALVEFGIIELMETVYKKKEFNIYLQEANKIKILLHPSLMGERFKAILFAKNNKSRQNHF